ncbi:hypothetical protein BDZ90DRAFT_278898 [Jaminaea rosea]|uniref:General negative regulator of transcription subunit n=1 Tax=Jaminaea rosea TaxID=1569628 RepID=A0A316UX98_9BASI|nr:hypothetical protein BDZ90DRAFT_278898 [Jaminaea rosea]PWN28543.1 hypothetical protein BDZ90DRAFT_278898 [Jaminaea rosea]
MAARKLAAEIDRTLKKVGEGVEQFESLYDKMQQSQNQAQKEKMESDLKTQIKKLQRLRDQIKTWQQSNDIKDKKALNDSRRSIEMQMERFKATEKEMKTKAFSKEGLIAAARLDPAEKAKADMANWLSTQVDELSRQTEATEAEIEQMQAGAGKKKKSAAAGASAEKQASLEHLNERRGWHVSRIEILHRMVENGQVEPERVEDIKEDISYFVESNAEEEFEEDEGIYDDFDLDEQEEMYGIKNEDDLVSSHDGDEPPTPVLSSKPSAPAAVPTGPASQSTPSKRRESESKEDAATGSSSTRKASGAHAASASSATPSASRKASDPSTRPSPSDPKPPPVPPANFAAAKQQPTLSPTQMVTSPPKSAAPPPIRYAAAAAAAVGSSNAPPAAPSPTATTNEPLPPVSSAPDSSAPSSEPAVPTAPAAAANAAPSPPNGEAAAASSSAAPGAGAPPAPPGLVRTQSPAVNGSGGKPSPSLTHSSLRQESTTAASTADIDGLPSTSSSSPQAAFQPASLSGASGAANAVQPTGGSSAATASATTPTKATAENRVPSSLADLVTSFESAKQRSLTRANEDNMASLHQSLESSFLTVPEPLDSEKPKYYIPRNPYPTPAYYPQTPASIFDNPSLYSKFDEDTLFFIFYYQQGTYHQYLAARELKKQSWRFHKQFLTWFRRHSEPQAITDEFEQGVYVYFDWEGSWAQRKKSDFRFEYRWLED